MQKRIDGDGPQGLDHLRGELSYLPEVKNSKTGIRLPERTDGANRSKPHPVSCRQVLNGPYYGYSHLSIRQGRVAGSNRCQKSAGKDTD